MYKIGRLLFYQNYILSDMLRLGGGRSGKKPNELNEIVLTEFFWRLI